MPKAKVERILSDDGTSKVIEVDVGQPDGGTKPARYTVPSNPKVAQEMVLGLTDVADAGAFERSVLGPDRVVQGETPLAFFYRMWVSAIDKTARQMAYEAAAAESTMVTIAKERIDIMSLPLARMVRAINRYRGEFADAVETLKATPGWKDKPLAEIEEAATKNVGIGPWNTAAKKLVQGYTDASGVVQSPKAKENTATGMLEPLTA